MCGEHAGFATVPTREEGSSPHVRGTLSFSVTFVAMMGIIPACAGNTTRGAIQAGRRKDHPRMCGEHMSSSTGIA